MQLIRLLVLIVALCPFAHGATCAGLTALVNAGTDAGAAFNACIAAATAGDTIDVVAGVYSISTQVLVNKALTLRTNGKSGASCVYASTDATCAEFKALSALDVDGGMFSVQANDTTFDYLVLNGNKANRAGSAADTECLTGSGAGNRAGFNMKTGGLTNWTFNHSVSKNALCGTGMETNGTNLVITNSAFAYGGVHPNGAGGGFADGLTVVQCTGSTLNNNTFVDNTDVDFVLGGCSTTTIQNNTILHSAAYASSSYAALLVHGFPVTSGDFTGSDISGNVIDCGANRRCGGGLIIGSNMWYTGPTFGGAVHNNHVKNAQAGLVIVTTTGSVHVYDNDVENAAPSMVPKCGSFMATYAYAKSASSIVDFSGDTVPAGWYITQDWTGCIPNYSDPPITPAPGIFEGEHTVKVAVTATTATFTWTTGSSLTDQVIYGTTTAYGSESAINYTLGTSHSVTLTGLTQGQMYHASLKNKEYPSGDMAQSADITFTPLPDATAVWFDTSWHYRKSIAVDSAAKVVGGADLSLVPILVDVTDNDLRDIAHGGKVGKSDASDVVFTWGDGRSTIPYEPELYDAATGHLRAWVKPHWLKTAGSTSLYAYFGKPNAADMRDAVGVWCCNYVGVWHMGDNSATTLLDSTVNAYHLDMTGTATTAGTGKIGGGQVFASGATAVNFTTANFLPYTVKGTEEVWIFPTTLGATVRRFLTLHADQMVLRQTDGSNLDGYVKTSGTIHFLPTSSQLSVNNWYSIAQTWDGTTQRVFKNGAVINSATPGGTLAPSVPTPVFFGSSAESFIGTEDEGRISRIARPANVLGTIYNDAIAPTGVSAFGSLERINPRSGGAFVQ